MKNRPISRNKNIHSNKQPIHQQHYQNINDTYNSDDFDQNNNNNQVVHRLITKAMDKKKRLMNKNKNIFNNKQPNHQLHYQNIKDTYKSSGDDFDQNNNKVHRLVTKAMKNREQKQLECLQEL
eukprot:Pgem_evm1s8040